MFVMQRAFLTRQPTAGELALLKKFLATYRDGTGGNREPDGSSRADSRQIERCFAELLHGRTTESKAFYDFVVESNESGGIAVRGASIKSKQVARLRDFSRQGATMRSYLELSNASAKDWALCRQRGLKESDFTAHRHAEEFGEVILARQDQERQASEDGYIGGQTSKFFLPNECVFISVLYSPPEKGERSWLISTFAVRLPKPTSWVFGGKALIGKDEDGDNLYEWYALSGSQFKYFPRLNARLNGTELFEVPKPAVETLRAKASRLFGD
jgi:hypothetical protein